MTRRLVSKKYAKVAGIVIGLLLILAQNKGWINVTETNLPISPGGYQVARFVDGDTITVDMDGKWETIRMIGVDTPETHKPDTPVQCYGVAAAAYTHSLIGEQKVRLQADPKNQNRDRYGRLLRHVLLPDGRSVAVELIKNGYGFAYTNFPFSYKDQFIEYEQQAKTEAKGLWGNCEVIIKGNYKQTNSLPSTQ